MEPREEGQDPGMYPAEEGVHECGPEYELELVKEVVRCMVLMDNSEWEDMSGE